MKDGGPAFPLPEGAGDTGRRGMSLRDWFAGQALTSIASDGNLSISQSASRAYDLADAHAGRTGDRRMIIEKYQDELFVK